MNIAYDVLSDLTFDNYLTLIEYIDINNYHTEFMSPLALLTWRWYGFEFKFKICKSDNTILFYLKEKDKNWALTSCFYNKSTFDYKNTLKNISDDIKLLNKNNSTITYNNISESMINDFEIDPNSVIELNYFSNYIYKTEKLKTYSGKKLQKKRNHLNNFYKQNYNVTIKKIKDDKCDVLMSYIKNHIMKHQDEGLDSKEIVIDQYFLEKEIWKSERYQGIVVYIDNQIVGITLCYVRQNICEIIIEKAEHEINGLYQYLIQQNIIVNNINTEYIDRQDDNFLPNLRKSKLSYYPEYAIKRFSSKV